MSIHTQCPMKGCGNTNLSRIGSVVSCACGWKSTMTDDEGQALDSARKEQRQRREIERTHTPIGKPQGAVWTGEVDGNNRPIFQDCHTGLTAMAGGGTVTDRSMLDGTHNNPCPKCGSALAQVGERQTCGNCCWTNDQERTDAILRERAEQARRDALASPGMLANLEMSNQIENLQRQIESLKAQQQPATA